MSTLLALWFLAAAAGTAVSAVLWRVKGVLTIFAVSLTVALVIVFGRTLSAMGNDTSAHDRFWAGVWIMEGLVIEWWFVAIPSAAIGIGLRWFRGRQISN